MVSLIACWTLFGASFFAATLLPLHSELLLFGLLATGHPPFWLWVSATMGNTLGSLTNWGLGRYLLHYQNRSWFPVGAKNLQEAQNRFQQFGTWTLLLAWLPVVGDAITFAAGALRVSMWRFLLWVGLGKGLRYAVVIALTESFFLPDKLI